MKKWLWITLATTITLGSWGYTTYAEEQPSSSDQAVVAVNKETATSEINDENDSSTDTEESTQDSQAATESSTESSEEQPKDDPVISSKQVDDTKKEVVNEITKQVNDGKKETVSQDILSSADSIRKALSKDADAYGITEKQINSYSDDQLMNTATLFKRYNQDLSGMDLAAFVRLLNALYQDQTLNVEDCLAQLSFNPESFDSYASLANNLDSLQTYLKTLYAPNSSFLPLKSLSNDELANILKDIQLYEEQAKADGHSLEGGKIAWISYAINHPNFAADINKKDGEQDATKDSGKNQAAQTSETSNKQTSNNEKKKDGLFPQTGEKRGLTIGVLGIVLILIVAGLYFWNRSKKNKE